MKRKDKEEDQKEKQTEKGLVRVHDLVINSSMLL